MDLRDKLLERRELREKELAAKHEHEELQKQRKKLDIELYEYMDHHRIEGMKVDGVNFVPTSTMYAEVQDEGSFIAWAQENDPSLLELRTRKDPLNQLVREKLDNGEPLPPGVGVYPDEKLSQRAA